MRDRRRWLGAAMTFIVLGCAMPGAPLVLQSDSPSPTPTAIASPQAVWIALGDSITVDAFGQLAAWNQALGSSAPTIVNAGAWGETAAQGLARLPALLAAHPGARAVGIGFGSNDAFDGAVTVSTFTANLSAMVAQIRAAGMRPAIATIPYSPSPDLQELPRYNAAIADLDKQLGLTPGPDLYAWFAQHPQDLQADGVHPNAAGDAAIQRLWAAVAAKLL